MFWKGFKLNIREIWLLSEADVFGERTWNISDTHNYLSSLLLAEITVLSICDIISIITNYESPYKHLQMLFQYWNIMNGMKLRRNVNYSKGNMDCLGLHIGKHGIGVNLAQMKYSKRGENRICQIYKKFFGTSAIFQQVHTWLFRDYLLMDWSDEENMSSVWVICRMWRAFQKLMDAIPKTTFIIAPKFPKYFRRHIDVYEIAGGGSLKHLYDNEKDKVIAVLSRSSHIKKGVSLRVTWNSCG